jgi:recombination associated protein RdgC
LFKNLLMYRLGPDWSVTLAQVDEALNAAPFVPCGATQPLSLGWVPPRGTAHGAMVESIGGQWLARLMTERKVVPGSVVKRRVDEVALQIERETGRKPGKKHSKEIKDQALLELLPQAFTKQAATLVWIDPDARLLMLDATSPAKADEVITALARALTAMPGSPGFAVLPLHTASSPAGSMAAWLDSGEPPAAFSVDRDCELKAADESKSVVRYARHALDIDEVRQHIAQGKQPTRLALTWDSRVSFVLTDTLQLKKLTFLDVVFEGNDTSHKTGQDEAFDADAAIATTELSRLIPDLIEALGGEQVPGVPAPATPPVPPAPPVPVPSSAMPAKVAASPTAEPAPWDA